jgi:hypothetical protein
VVSVLRRSLAKAPQRALKTIKPYVTSPSPREINTVVRVNILWRRLGRVYENFTAGKSDWRRMRGEHADG